MIKSPNFLQPNTNNVLGGIPPFILPSSGGGTSIIEFDTLAQLDAYKATSTSSFTFLVSSIGYIGIYSITAGEFAIAGNR